MGTVFRQSSAIGNGCRERWRRVGSEDHRSAHLQTARSEAEKILERKGAGQADVDAARADEHVGGDLQ